MTARQPANLYCSTLLVGMPTASATLAKHSDQQESMEMDKAVPELCVNKSVYEDFHKTHKRMVPF